MSLAPGLIDIGSFIDQREGYRGGRPFIVGTGVTVDRVSVLLTVDGLSPEEIADAANLTLPQVHAAISFYLANRESIESALDEQVARYDRATEQPPRS